jgi:predicted RNA-binding protein with PIN domain
MPFLIDGHNLIPKLPGIQLTEIDDEQKLIELLQNFCRITRKQVEVFFDNAPPGVPRARNFGLVIAHFTPSGQTADEAISRKLARLGRSARNWTVVSSDHAVQASARARRASVLPSDQFAALMVKTMERGGKDAGKPEDPQISEDELDDWLDIFKP